MAWDDDAYSISNYYDYGIDVPTAQAQPVDAGGGSPGVYSGAILDIFKTGISAAAGVYNQKQLLDYKRWEATNRGVYLQGYPGGIGITTGSGGGTNLLLIGLAVVAVVVLTK